MGNIDERKSGCRCVPHPFGKFPELGSSYHTTTVPSLYNVWHQRMAYCYKDRCEYRYEYFDSDIDEDILKDYIHIRTNIDRECNEVVGPNASSSTTLETEQDRDWNILTISSDLKLGDVERRDLFSKAFHYCGFALCFRPMTQQLTSEHGLLLQRSLRDVVFQNVFVNVRIEIFVTIFATIFVTISRPSRRPSSESYPMLHWHNEASGVDVHRCGHPPLFWHNRPEK